MRLLDLILAIAVLAAIVFIARHQFPSYEGKSYAPPSPMAVSPSPLATSTP